MTYYNIFHLLAVNGRLCSVFTCVQDKKDLPDYENSWLKDLYAVMISHLIVVSVGKVDQTHC